jgi:hypothetical protein
MQKDRTGVAQALKELIELVESGGADDILRIVGRPDA